MGVPFLFQAIAERYPSLVANVTANQLPDYEYLHIDMNFLIHKAVDKNCRLPSESLDEHFYDELRIFERIFRWIETLYRLVRPKKLLFLAMDGVAPRAKFNTQKRRRYQKAEDGMSEFDQNCISPGTEFMIKLDHALNDFVKNKVKFDRSWQNGDILISGPNCAGEGSIKIIEYIRSLKRSKSYDENVTHCIYSGDNDFLSLGLALNVRYISLLQESKNNSLRRLGSLCVDDVKHEFNVMHFEMLREYIEMEFNDLKDQMKFKFNTDGIISDWVLILMLFGNDYIPNLPNFELRFGTLSIVIDCYKKTLPQLDDYINKNGCLDVERFIQFVDVLKLKDFDLFQRIMNPSSGLGKQMNSMSVDDSRSTNGKRVSDLNEFFEFRNDFYEEHFGDMEPSELEYISNSYIKTLQWILFYYYRGSCSWTYHYPYFVAPFVTDVACTNGEVFVFEVDKPVKPFDHLMAILPKISYNLLPNCFLNYVQEHRNVTGTELMEKFGDSLTDEELKRNTEQPIKCYRFEKIGKNVNESVHVEHLDNNSTITSSKRNFIRNSHEQIINPKFSTLKLHDYKGVLQPLKNGKQRLIINLQNETISDFPKVVSKFLNESVYINWPHCCEAKVFSIMDAKSYRMVEGIEQPEPDLFDSHVELLNNRYSELGINVGEIKIIALVAPLIYSENKPTNDNENTLQLTKIWSSDYALKPVPIQMLVKCYERFDCVKHVEKELSKLCAEYGAPMVCMIGNNTRYFGEMVSVVDTKNLKSTGRLHILGYADKEPDFTRAKEAHASSKLTANSNYRQLQNVATSLSINAKVLSIITGKCFVLMTNRADPTTEKVPTLNIGLQFKDFKTMKILPGYAKSEGNIWLLSDKAIDVVKQYMETFPHVFQLLNSMERMYVSDFNQNNNDGLEYLSQVRKWLEIQPYQKEAKKPVAMKQLSESAIAEVKKAVQCAFDDDSDTFKLQVKWKNIFIPDLNDIFVIPQPEAEFNLLDRVIIVRSGYPMPVGTKGTVVGIEPNQGCTANRLTENEIFAMNILMDYPYKIHCDHFDFERHHIFRTRSTNMLINISHR